MIWIVINSLIVGSTNCNRKIVDYELRPESIESVPLELTQVKKV